ncbi:hypothetical protein Tco_1275809 [Tanacetum coccineum]
MKLMNIRAERIAKSANPLTLVAAAQPYSDHYYQAPKSQRSNAQASKQSSSTRPMNPNKLRGIRIMQKNLHSFQSNSRSSTNLPTSTFVLLQTLEQDVQIPHQVKDSEVRYLKNPVTEQPLEQVKEGRDIDKMIEMDKQIKFLNEILYKRNQSIQTIHMLAPKCSTYNGRPTFANPRYLKKAQSEKPCLYEIPYDTSDHANRFCPNGEETVTLEKESRSKLNKDTVKPYDYTYQNSLYEIFKPPSKTYLDQLERAKEVRKTMWRKTFVRTKPNIAKNVAFLPVSKSISKSRQAYNEMTNNFNHFRTICEQAWSNHTRSSFRNPTAHDMEVLIKSLLMPLSIKTINDSYCFVHELKTEMHEDFEWIPTGKLLNSCTGKVESEPTHGSNVDIPHIHACKQTLGLSAGTSFNGQKQQRIDLNADALYNVKQENLRVWLLKMLISKKPVPESSDLVLHQMTSDHNRSELGIHDHNNEPSSSKLVPKVVP